MEDKNVLTMCPTREMDASEISILHRYYRIHLVGHTLELKIGCVWARVKSLQLS